MSVILPILILLSMLLVLAVLGLGIFSMMKGGDFNKKHGNKLMRLRVLLQGLTILLLVVSFYLSQN